MAFDIDDELPDRESGKMKIKQKMIFLLFYCIKLDNSIKNMIQKKFLVKVFHQLFVNVLKKQRAKNMHVK